MKEYSYLYKQELLENVIPFWMNHSKDEECGGYFTCLDRSGKVFDRDKFIWLQGREVWMFSSLYHQVENKKEWKEMAIHGAEFLSEYGRDQDGSFYFSLTRDGKPLIQPYNIFSDCFAAMGLGALYKIHPEPKYAQIARDTFYNILKRKNNPKGKYLKNVAGTRALKSFALPMILSNLSLELEHIIGNEVVDALAQKLVREIIDDFYHEEWGVLLENVNMDGRFNDSFEGRLINPGHGLEAMWFLMDLAERLGDENIVKKAVAIALNTLEKGWDQKYGGIFYFMDVLGHPTQQLEWDQKLWWVHLEALVCMAKAYRLTGNKECANWFRKIHLYTWEKFRDSEYGEWFGYLNRRGEVLLPNKGGKWKGCFHVPRGLYQIWKCLAVPADVSVESVIK
ncbi:AGE family epimerase/isomerase [Rapidithrix thailandica]|uniref:AGE family epimerase/isomerase n=1 Tax=Rapidithrix thailandica TaxID=413964 RepID=A0AAW9S0Y9_9BACT